MINWNSQKIEVATSKGGVIAVVNPYDNLVTTGVSPWPPAEIVQKLYQSRHTRDFADDQKEKATGYLGYYSDLQSLHSEDAITWSAFGTVSHASKEKRNTYLFEFFKNINIQSSQIENSEIFLWRRIAHPDTLVSGGPEIDFGILTGDTLLLGEAKWKSSVGVAQGKNKDKDQIQLRVEFLNTYGPQLYPKVKQFIVMGVGLKNDVTENRVIKSVKCVGKTWDEICAVASHPYHDELQRYLTWKKENTKNI